MGKNQKENSRKKTSSIPFGRKRPFWRNRECRVPPAQREETGFPRIKYGAGLSSPE
jgi:hypothetical protein